MSIVIQQVNTAANADTFGIAWTRLNQVINAISTQVVSVDATGNGSITVGNGHVSGYLSATLLATNTLRGGNVSTSNTLTIISDVNVSNGVLYVGNSSVNNFINSTFLVVNNAVISSLNVTSLAVTTASLGNSAIGHITSVTAGTSSQIVDSFLLTSFRAAEYVITVTDNGSNSQQVSKLLLIQNGGNTLVTEYATLLTNGTLGVFSGGINSTAVQLVFTPVVANATVQAIRTSVQV